jgi:hypothetical protein
MRLESQYLSGRTDSMRQKACEVSYVRANVKGGVSRLGEPPNYLRCYDIEKAALRGERISNRVGQINL